MKIKVCGLKYPENIKAVAALNPDYMGFIFYGASPRFVNEIPEQSLSDLPDTTLKTGVFVNQSVAYISAQVAKYGLEAIQLHGSESPEFCSGFRGKVTVIKAFGINEDFDFTELNAYDNTVDFFLFDTKTDIHGGSGKRFNWEALEKYDLNIPFFLSGGISPDNLEEIKSINHPQFYGVDLNSKFEISPGLKSIEKLEKAFDIIKQTQYK